MTEAMVSNWQGAITQMQWLATSRGNAATAFGQQLAGVMRQLGKGDDASAMASNWQGQRYKCNMASNWQG